jgi:hypothetical protein
MTYEPSMRFEAPRRLFAMRGFYGGILGRTRDPEPNGEQHRWNEDLRSYADRRIVAYVTRFQWGLAGS